MDILFLVKGAAVLLAGLLLGRWFDQERKKLKAMGQPSYKTWKTAPGVIIIIAIVLLIALRIYVQQHQ